METAQDARPWEQLRALLDDAPRNQIDAWLDALPASEVARVVSRLTREEQDRLLTRLRPDDAADLVEQLPDPQAADIVERLDPADAARIVRELKSDEQADLLLDLKERDAEAILAELAPAEADAVRTLAEYPSDVAGGLMVTEFVAFYDMQGEDVTRVIHQEVANEIEGQRMESELVYRERGHRTLVRFERPEDSDLSRSEWVDVDERLDRDYEEMLTAWGGNGRISYYLQDNGEWIITD